MDRRWRYPVWLLPAVALTPLLTAKIPVTIHGPREIAGYFQSLAFARTGLGSFFFLTPEESFSALHLHSFLSSPLIALGYAEGGRLISLISAISAVIIVGMIASELTNRRVGLLASALLWAQPMFVRHAWVFQPETLSIAITSGAVLCSIRYVRSGDKKWFAGAALLLIFGIANHMWEATIALPVFAVLLWDRRWKAGASVALIAPISARVVMWITELQPEGPTTLYSHGTHNVGFAVFFSPEFWLAHLTFHQGLPAPYGLGLTIVLPLSVAFCVYWGYRAVMEGTIVAVVLSSWLASGLAIPALLARGYMIHYYYLWAILAPVSITVAIWGYSFLEGISSQIKVSGDKVVRTTLAILILSSLSYGIVFQYGALGNSGLPVVEHIEGEPYERPEATEAGFTLRRLNPSPDQLLFVGEWEHDFNREAGRVAVYSDILFKQRVITDTGGPDIVDGLTSEDPCEVPQSADRVILRKTGEGIRIADCRSES